MQKLWDTDYKPTNIPNSTSSQPLPPPSLSRSSKPANSYLKWRKKKTTSEATVKDKYSRYCKLPRVFSKGLPHEWWLEPQQQLDFPNLSRMAIDILSIPAMSSSAERLFSSASLTISDRRCRLGIDVIKAIECLKSWFSLPEWVEDHECYEKVEFDGNTESTWWELWRL
jgi:hypothetical protein